MKVWYFLTFPACFSIPIIFPNFDFNCSNLSSLRNLQEQVKKAFCYQELFWPFTVWIKCSSDLKSFENSRPSASNFKSFSRSLEQFFLTVGQNNFGNKIPEIPKKKKSWLAYHLPECLILKFTDWFWMWDLATIEPEFNCFNSHRYSRDDSEVDKVLKTAR